MIPLRNARLTLAELRIGEARVSALLHEARTIASLPPTIPEGLHVWTGMGDEASCIRCGAPYWIGNNINKSLRCTHRTSKL